MYRVELQFGMKKRIKKIIVIRYKISMFKKWCRDHGFYNKSNISHVLMDGGILSVPFERLNEFYDIYLKAVNLGEKIFVVEQKTTPFNFFVDLDYKDEEDIPFERLEEYVRIVCDRVTLYGGKDVLISAASPKYDGNNLKKYGIHMNWPGFVVDHASAMALYSHIVSTMNLMFPGKPWDNIVDASVYGNGRKNVKGSGFRMPWSHKYVKGEIHGEYKPVIMYTHEDGKLTRIFDEDPTIEIMYMATVRTQSTSINIIEGSVRDEGSFSANEMKNEFRNETTSHELAMFIQNEMEGQSRTQIRKIFGNKHTFLVSSNSRYCENREQTHSSNHVWFLINGKTIQQRCFCTCETMKGRRYGYCKDFYGRKHMIPEHIFKELYPDGYHPPTVSTPQNTCMPCTKENVCDSVVICEEVQKFINRNMIEACCIKVESMTKKSKNMRMINTDYTCSVCKKNKVKFKITKNRIIMACSCNSREHNLSDKIIRLL